MTEFLDSTPSIDDPVALRECAARDGYLFVRGLVPPEAVTEVRRAFLPLLAEAGWIRTDAPLEDAVAKPDAFCVEPEPDYRRVYHRLYRERAFHALQHHPRLIGFFERLFGERVFVHPRAIHRIIFPRHEEYTTPAHQDFVPIQGAPDTWSVWIPLSDCPLEFGSLQVAEGCHTQGVHPIRPTLGAGGLGIAADLEGRWRGGSFRLGDAVIFHSLTPHRALPNRTERLRMSVDFRYQRAAEPVAPDSLLPHDPRHISWEEIYAGWADPDPLKYYWKAFHMQEKPYDPSWHEERDTIAFQMAEHGDRNARSALTRIVARDADPGKRTRAADLLARLDASSAT